MTSKSDKAAATPPRDGKARTAGPAVPGAPGSRLGVLFGAHHRRAVPTILSALIIFLGLLNILSIVISNFTRGLAIPRIDLIPVEFVEAGNFIHVVIGLTLIYLGYHLYLRKREAWTVILLLLFLSLIASALSSRNPASLVTGLVTVYLMVMLYIYRAQFTTPSIARLSASRMSVLLFWIIMIIFGIVGSKTLGDEFRAPIGTWTQAVYFTISTMTTVGYGDHVPVSDSAQWFTIILMVMGFASFIILIGSLIGPYIEDRLQRVIRMVGGVNTAKLANHLIICGTSTEGKILMENLMDRKDSFVVVLGTQEKHEELVAEGVVLVVGDPSESDVLEKVGVGKARALLAISDDDAANAFVTVTARKLNPALNIIAMVSSRENVQKLKSVGATTVISPSVIGAERILAAACGDD